MLEARSNIKGLKLLVLDETFWCFKNVCCFTGLLYIRHVFCHLMTRYVIVDGTAKLVLCE